MLASMYTDRVVVHKNDEKIKNKFRIDLVINNDFLIESAFLTIKEEEIRVPFILDFRDFNINELSQRLHSELSDSVEKKNHQFKAKSPKI